MELLCGVLDAMPYPTALLDTELMPAYVNDGKCPIPFEDVDFAALSEARMALGGAAQPAQRTRLTAGMASCFGLLELFPVRVGEDEEKQVAGVLAIFRPEFAVSEMTADAMPTRSAVMDSLWTRLQRYALLASPVLFLGEEGVGKVDFARALHRMSARREKPFVVLEAPTDDAALPETVRDSEDGALLCIRLDTWPQERQRQLVELLDSKNLTAPDGQVVYRKCRVMATAPPEGAGELLPALTEWFGSMTVSLPPLRDRQEDILPAAREFLSRFALREDKDIQGLSMDAQEILRHYAWPGNLSELRSVMETAVRTCPGGLVLASHLPVGGQTGVTLGKGGLQAMRTAYTREQIASLLAVYGHTVEAKRRAAKELGIGLSTLYRVMAKEG